MSSVSVPRQLWSLFEAVHAVIYFDPAALAALEAAGLRGFWRGYFANRTAPLGAVGAGPVTAAFFGFAPAMVARAVPDVWTRISPEAALAARADGARAALSGLLAGVAESQVAEAAELLSAAALAVDLPGRVLAAANADLPSPQDPAGRLWHAATILREHRGDGHVAALLTAGVDGCESVVWRSVLEAGALPARMQAARGWSDEQWQAAARRLTDRGWVDGDGSATQAARDAYAQVEAVTDRLAAGPWERLGDDATQRCARLLEPLAARAWAVLPADNPIPLRPAAALITRD
ncbi:SCO6745 family protein [Actinoplanes sp. NPDC026623]|uniref:SCO6745 family protein n=1 Tax=Actinoplanes sp. NPDC026623 TaxID=3155610 RepID=UPI0033F69315